MKFENYNSLDYCERGYELRFTNYRARIMSWQFCVDIFWNTRHLAEKLDHYSWIQEVQHLPLKPKIYIKAIIGYIS